MAVNPREIDEKLADLDTKRATAAYAAARQMGTIHSAAGDKARYVTSSRREWGQSDAEVLATVRATLVDADDYTLLGGFYAKNVRTAVADYDAQTAAVARLDAEMAEVEAPYFEQPWTRFFQLRSTRNAKIHRSRWCARLHRSDPNDMGWHPEFSGMDEAQAVTMLGGNLCGTCFKGA